MVVRVDGGRVVLTITVHIGGVVCLFVCLVGWLFVWLLVTCVTFVCLLGC